MFAVIRNPCLMEDEGRTFFIGIRATRKEAEDLVKEKTADGYFRSSDYSVIEQEGK